MRKRYRGLLGHTGSVLPLVPGFGVALGVRRGLWQSSRVPASKGCAPLRVSFRPLPPAAVASAHLVIAYPDHSLNRDREPVFLG